MNHPDYNSPAALKTFMESQGFSMQKKFGQNFLINEDARKRLVDALEVGEGVKVWEVGPGLGSMTSEILERGSDLTVFEIDKGFTGLISQFFEDYSKKGTFKLVEGDVLKTWKKQLDENNLPDRFFGNLPYNIAATIIADTIENNVRFDKCVFTVQKEVAVRMCAQPGSEDYSSFSVLCNWAYDVKPLLDLTGGNFWPKPNVDSRAVVMNKKEGFPGCNNPKLFVRMQRSLFSSRRKTVRNNLSGFLKNNDLTLQALSEAEIDPMKRAEVLTIPQMLKLSDVIDKLNSGN
ncbi:MAG: 16S rRNA (adenine(1518)-N(6)/adenine(1519)-N(6))-dimethyltransferase RsmA [Spirochaetia bacterium]|nr:16S rRNA (adenine(1518)-N(6)/adenine(1519)-N(6))-dimethyltransferase RsmA [Spirochaetia bacterium]